MLMKHEELLLSIKEMVTSNPGQRLPSERSLALSLGVSRAKVRHVLDRLESDRLIVRQRGSGNYAVDPHKEQLSTVAILVDRDLKLGNDPFYTMLLEQLQSALQHEGVRSLIERIDQDTVLRHQEDALITLGYAGKAVIESLGAEGPPVLGFFVDANPYPGAQVSLVQTDNFDAGYQAGKYLCSLGVKELCFVGPENLPASKERYLGAKYYCNQHGKRINRLFCRMNYSGGFEAAQQLGPVEEGALHGVIASNDWVAIGCHTSMISLGQEQRSRHVLVSFDGLPITRDPSLEIHSMAMPVSTIVRDSIFELQRYIDHPTGSGRVLKYRFEWSKDMIRRLALKQSQAGGGYM
jgi:DNA-binding LacI/PurR family transcriptional regulator